MSSPASARATRSPIGSRPFVVWTRASAGKQGFDALIRPEFGHVCHWLIVVSYWTPGSAQRHAAWGMSRMGSRAGIGSPIGSPVLRASVRHSSSCSTACMNASVTRTELLAFWYWIDWKPSPSIDMSNPARARASAFSSSRALHQMNSRMSGWSTSSTTIFAAHERHRPARRAALGQRLHRPADVGEVDARPGAAAEDPTLLGVPVEDRLHVVLDAEDEAGRALRGLLEAHVEPDRRVERRHLVQEHVRQLGLERVAVLGRGEVAARPAPIGDRAGDARDHLLDRALAGGRVELAAEVLLGDDVRRVLRPRARELDVRLLEGDLAAVADPRVAQLPPDRVERMDPRTREDAPDCQRLTGVDVLCESHVGGGFHCRRLLFSSPRFSAICGDFSSAAGGPGSKAEAPDGTVVGVLSGYLPR